MLAESHIADNNRREEFPVRRDFCPAKPIFVSVLIRNSIGKKLIILSDHTPFDELILTMIKIYLRLLGCSATIAQMEEQLICNQQVAGSIPAGGSILEVWPSG